VKIKKLMMTNFRRFDEFELEFDPQLTVLVAPNGAGKTSVLDAVATLLGGYLTRLPKVSGINLKVTDFRVFPDRLSYPPYMRIGCESFDQIAWDRTQKRDQTQRTAKEIPDGLGLKLLNDHVDKLVDAYNEGADFELPIFIYYGAGRGVFDAPKRKTGFRKVFTRFEAFAEALESKTNFRRFVEYFYSLEDRERKLQQAKKSFDVELPELKAIREAVNRLMPEFSNPRGAEAAGIVVDWETDSGKKELLIEQLSDGYRTTLAMVMDIASRMAEANPNSNVLETTGVVLIDEVDLHLHPGWQQRILTDLTRTFPNVQFIVTTHSPQVVSSVQPKSLRVIGWRNDTPFLIPVGFSEGAEAQQMLMDVLGVESPRPDLPIVQKLKLYQQLVEAGQWDEPEALKLRKELDKWGAEYEPELARLDMDIRLKELDR